MELGLLTVFGAGLLTLATPCILPMLPVYFALLLGEGVGAAQQRPSRLRLVGVAALFVAGFSTVFTVLGMAASSVGAALQSHRSLLLLVGGAVILIFGLKALGVIRIAWLDRTLQPPAVQSGSRLLNAFAFGVVFALGWTPCVGPVLGSVLTLTAATTSSPATGALYLFVYSLGVGLPLLAVSAVADRLVPQLRKVHRHLPKIERVTGALMVVVGLAVAVPGVLQLWSAPQASGAIASAHAEAATGQPRLVEFYAPGCPVCERMAPLIEQLRGDCMGHRIDVMQVDVSDPEHAAAAREYGIVAVPAFVLLDGEGKLAGQMYGERGLAELRGAAASLISATCAGQTARADVDTAHSRPSCTSIPAEPDPEVVECSTPDPADVTAN